MIFGIIIIAILALLYLKYFSDQKKKDAAWQDLVKAEYGKKPSEAFRRNTETCSRAYLHRRKDQDFYLDDITWNDLEMEKVFHRINYTWTAAGAETLYSMMRIPEFDAQILEERKRLIGRLQEQQQLREELADRLGKIGNSGKYALEDYLESLMEVKPENSLAALIRDFLYLPAVLLILIQPAAGLILLFGLILLNVTLYFKKKAVLKPYLVCFGYILRMIEGAEEVCRLQHSGIEEETGRMKKIIADLSRFRRFSGIAISMQNPTGSSNPLDLLFDYLRMLFHIDLIKFNQMLRECHAKKEEIISLRNMIGTLDAVQSIACYRASLKQYCIPELRGKSEKEHEKENDSKKENKPKIEAEELVHPLLNEPVGNSIIADRSILLTGSNASGKSTFLKAVAINAVFAQSLVTCTALSWKSEYYRVISSMSLRDNLTSGESYYIVEIKSLKRIMDAAQETDKPDLLCFIDEVLRGTNTVERIAASCQILKELSHEKALCFAATHDLELSYLLSDWYQNFHFEEEIENQNIFFSYQLRTGRSVSRNAIRLLGMLGYEEKVIKDAEEMASAFLENGEWKIIT